MSLLPGLRGSVSKHLPLFLVVFSPTIAFLARPVSTQAQSPGILRGKVADPSGAFIPGASVFLTAGLIALHTCSGSDGAYIFNAVPPGSYNVQADAKGFAHFSQTDVVVESGQARDLLISLAIAVEQQNIEVTSQTAGVTVNSDENSSAIVIKDSDLDALSDDPDELQNELQALAGPSAGPNGGEIYIDGFSGGQIPPKSSIREIRINQNPFSAEFDRIGYGRIEILTKPGSDKFSGHVTSIGNQSSWNTTDPLVKQQPSYCLWFIQSDVTGPLTKHASYFANFFHIDRQNQAIIDAVDPDNTSATINAAIPNPSSFTAANPRVDFQLGKSNTLSIRDAFSHSVAAGNGPGQLNLQQQAANVNNTENNIQISDTVVVNTRLINETHFQWRRVRNSMVPSFLTPTVTVEGSFTTGGSNGGSPHDHQDDFELQNYSTANLGAHTLRFGTRVRSYRDANYSDAGSNGSYLFTSVPQYLAQTPAQYQATIIQNPLARVLLFDGALFYQDEWRVRPYLNLSDGLRFETQNHIHDHEDLGPRLALAWAAWHQGTKPPKTVIRAGYGWFYDRFTVPTSFGGGGAPYLIQAIHQNGINQQNYVVNGPSFYNPNQAAPPSSVVGPTGSVPTVYSIDPHFHASLEMQGGIGVDQQLHKLTFNVSYLLTRGVHQYFTNNITAPGFDPSTYAITSALPSVYNYQYQSRGVFRQQQVIASANLALKHFTLHGNYTYNVAKGDTQGVSYIPSVAQNPSFDYGRPVFAITNRLFFLGTWNLPHGIILAPLIAAQSGTPYNVVTGYDYTGNNQFNARPTFGICGAANVVSTPYGCLDADPVGKGEQIVPFGFGTGPANFVMHMRASKAIGIGPRIKGATGNNTMQGNTGVGGRGLSAGQAPLRIDAEVPRKYSLTLAVAAINVFNIVNLGPPNGTLSAPLLFGKSQSLASGPFGSPVAGNRFVVAQANFTF